MIATLGLTGCARAPAAQPAPVLVETACQGFGGSTLTETRTSDGVLTAFELGRGDFDCDGIDDALVGSDDTGSGVSGEVWLFRALGDGTFAPWRHVAGQGAPVGFTVGDFNRDGALDALIVRATGYAQGHIDLVTGRCDGALQVATAVPASQGYLGTELGVGDINGDGFADAVLARWESPHGVTVLLGGATPFARRLDWPDSYDQHPTGVAVGDVDGDGDLDVVVPIQAETRTGTSRTVVLRNAGGGVLESADALDLDTSGLQTVVRDFDGDGTADLLARVDTARDGAVLTSLEVAFSDRTGHPARVTRLPGYVGIGVAVADFDGDGRQDIAAISPSGPHGSVYRNEGGGAFAPYALQVGTWQLVPGDFTGRGRADLLTLRDTTHLELFANGCASPRTLAPRLDPAGASARTCGAGVAFNETLYPAGETSVVQLLVGDVSGDGVADIVARLEDTRVGLLRGVRDAPDRFQPMEVYTTGLQGEPVLADVDGDGASELVFARRSDAGYALVRPGRVPLVENVAPAGFPVVIAAASGDFDRDGRTDLAFIPNNEFSLALVPASDPTRWFAMPVPTGWRAVQLTGVARDDRGADLVMGMGQIGDTLHPTSSACFVRLLLGQSAVCSPATGPAVWLDAGDLDGDGVPELVTRDVLALNAYALDETGVFVERPLLRTPSFGWTAARLGRFVGTPLDVLVGDAGGALRVYAGNGAGNIDTSSPRLRQSASVRIEVMTVADLDGDRRTDVIAAGPTPLGDALSVLRACAP